MSGGFAASVKKQPLKVGLICTADLAAPGSMRAYTDTLEQALNRYAGDISPVVLRIGSQGSTGAFERRMQTLFLLAKAWAKRSLVPDVWHVLDGSRAYLASALKGVPLVVTAHDLIPWLQSQSKFDAAPATGSAARWLWRWNGACMRRATVLVCDSQSTQRDAQDYFAVDHQRSRVVPLPLRPGLGHQIGALAPVLRDVGHVLHVGNNGFYKARDLVLRIFARLGRNTVSKLSMLGPPPTAALLNLSASLGITEYVEWIDDPDDTRLIELYRRASLLIFPSRYEGFGWPVLEAMSFGLPVVSSNRGSLPEVAGTVFACIDPDDIDAFAAAAQQLLGDPAKVTEISAAGQQHATQFNEKAFAASMRDAYWAAFRDART